MRDMAVTKGRRVLVWHVRHFGTCTHPTTVNELQAEYERAAKVEQTMLPIRWRQKKVVLSQLRYTPLAVVYVRTHL